MRLPIKRLSYRDIGQKAREFLQTYHPDLSLPIPIEEIAESKLSLNITQEQNLKKDYDIDAFLTSDLSTIFIDFDLYMRFEERTRLTIAHEIGHLVLHGDMFKQLKINTTKDLNAFVSQTTDEEYRWLEYKAYSFANQLLVPSELLIQEIKRRLGKVPFKEVIETLYPIAQDLKDVFQVSGEVLLIRLQKEGVVETNLNGSKS